MSVALSEPVAGPRRLTLSRRAVAILLALAIEVLVILALLGLAPDLILPKKPADNRPISFNLAPAPNPEPTAGAKAEKPTEVHRSGGGAPAKAPTPAPQPTAAPAAKPNAPDTTLLQMSKDEFAQSDIGALAKGGGSGAGSSSGKDSGAAYGPSEGPGGATLYNAEWYREPTHAELVTYMRPGMASGWGEVACQTVEHYHVENCRALGETAGSGISRMLREASWQFLVRPPRIGGRLMVGAWVRIHFDLRDAAGKEAAPPPAKTGRDTAAYADPGE